VTSPSAKRTARSPTYTSRIERVLADADDFVVFASLQAALPDIEKGELYSSLNFLRRMKAVDFLHSSGQTFWFATPASDTRQRKYAEKAHHGECARGGKPRTKRTLKDINPEAPSLTPKDPT